MSRMPTDWGMCTERGNRKLTKLAEAFTLDANKSLSPTTRTKCAARAVLMFFTKANLLGDRKGTKEVSDTAVREELFEYAWDVVKGLGVCRSQVEDLYWDVL